MAHRIITQLVLTSTRVFSRAFLEAYRHARAQQVYRTANPSAAGSGSGSSSITGGSSLTIEEACKILNVEKQTSKEEVMERYKRMFDANDPKKGGSFYLQSKIYRARERLERELGSMAEGSGTAEGGAAAAVKAEGSA